ncbi:MAG: DUF3016 domain-containing protein [Proteobacteria bacterium]|nr:DUF3016 domain-containing protein [Pseudomonadota bacterium]
MQQAFLPIVAAALLGCAAHVGASAGTVEVRYDALKIHSDAGNTAAQREGRLEALAEHLRTLGAQRLPAGQRLEVELIDLDLTGTVRIARHALGEVRVVNGRADGPHIELAYTLRDAGGAALASGRETLYDAGLPRLGELRDASGGDPLRHEKTLLDHWFEARFGAAP